MQLALDLSHLLPRARRAVLICDVVESVRLAQEDEDGYVRRWQQLEGEIVRDITPAHEGRLVKSTGDGLMIEFAQPRQAVQAALSIQTAARALHTGAPPQQQLHLRVGVHSADVVAGERDIYGHGVNLAARLMTLAGPGEIVVSAEVRDQLVPVLDGDIEDLGDCYLKHVKEPVRAYRVGEAGPAPIFAPGANRPLDLRPTVAVIPFAARGMEPGHALIGEAVADELIAAISKTAELHVISRLSTSAFKERAGDAAGPGMLENVRQHLGATYVLSGRCTVLGQQMHLFVELAEADGGRIVWADSLKGSVSGLFDPEDDMLSRVVSAVSSAVMRTELQRAQNNALPTLEGYTLLLSAIAMMHRNDVKDHDRARLMLEHLCDRSGRHPVPHAWLAKWYVLHVSQGWSANPNRDSQLGVASVQRALDHDPTNALALTIDGVVQSNLLKNMNRSVERLQEALAANPNEPLAWLLLGNTHAFMGGDFEPERETQHAIRLSPLDPLKYYYDALSAGASLLAGKYEKAIELALRSLRANSKHLSTHRILVASYELKGDHATAQQHAASLLKADPTFSVKRFLDQSPIAEFPIAKKLASALTSAGIPH